MKQGTTYDPIIYCTNTAAVYSISDRVEYRYGKAEARMPLFMDDLSSEEVESCEKSNKKLQGDRNTEKKWIWNKKRGLWLGTKKEDIKKEKLQEDKLEKTDTWVK